MAAEEAPNTGSSPVVPLTIYGKKEEIKWKLKSLMVWGILCISL